MKKNYQKPTINKIVNLKRPHLLVGSQGETPVCTTDNSCPNEGGY